MTTCLDGVVTDRLRRLMSRLLAGTHSVLRFKSPPSLMSETIGMLRLRSFRQNSLQCLSTVDLAVRRMFDVMISRAA